MKRCAIAQLKGGVGKSSTTLFIAEHWAMRGKRILVVDLDPQASVSFMLLSKRGVQAAEAMHKTLPQFFEDARADTCRDAESYITQRASDIIELHSNGPGRISILPSVPKLWFEHYKFDRDAWRRGDDPVDRVVAILDGFLNLVQSQYDCVLFDCPPGFNSLTRAAIRLCPERVVAPTIADFVSLKSLQDFAEIGLEGQMKMSWHDRMFVVVSKYSGSNQQRTALDGLRRTYQVIEPPIPVRDQVQIATECLDDGRRTFAEKYGRPRLRPISAYIKPMTDRLFSVTFA